MRDLYWLRLLAAGLLIVGLAAPGLVFTHASEAPSDDRPTDQSEGVHGYDAQRLDFPTRGNPRGDRPTDEGEGLPGYGVQRLDWNTLPGVLHLLDPLPLLAS